jgi:hypothetical protein
MNKTLGIWAVVAAAGLIARPGDGKQTPRGAPGAAAIDRRYETPYDTILRAHASDLNDIADLLDELGKNRREEPLVREILQSERGYELLVVLPEPVPTEPTAPSPAPYPFFASKTVGDLLFRLLDSTFDFGEPPKPNRTNGPALEPEPRRGVPADEHPRTGISIDEITVEALYQTSIGNLARGRARGREVWLRQGDRLADGEVGWIEFLQETVGRLSFRRRVRSTPGVPYRPVVWLLAARGAARRSEGAGLTIGGTGNPPIEAVKLDESLLLRGGFPPWIWEFPIDRAPRWVAALAGSSDLLEKVEGSGRRVRLRAGLDAYDQYPFQVQWPIRPDDLEESYEYDPGVRSDPFVDLSARPFAEPKTPGGRPGGVAGLLIDEVEVEGLFRTPQGAVAEVRSLGRLYFLREGDQLWDGDVVSIDLREGLLFKQIVQDPMALRPFREIVKGGTPGRLFPPPGAVESSPKEPEEIGFDETFVVEEEVLSGLWDGNYDPGGRRDPFRPLPPAQVPIWRTPSSYALATCASLPEAEGLPVKSLADADRWLARYLWERGLVADVPSRNGPWGRRFLADLDAATFGPTLRPAEALALFGDLNVIAGRLPKAAKLYALADRIEPGQATRCGRLYQGKLYAAESFGLRLPIDRYRLPFYAALTGYLLGWDPATERVVERHLLPALPKAFTVERGKLRIAFEGESIVELAGRRLSPPARVSSDLNVRSIAIRNGTLLALNFLGSAAPGKASPRLRVGRNFDRRLPLDLPELEQALRAAAHRDPTQPWHPFFLGQALFAQGRGVEAETLWRALWSGGTGNTPYYELFQMALLHERFGQSAWADCAYAQALRERRRLARPSASIQEVEWWGDADLYGPNTLLRDPDRRHLWWRRLREIFGVAPGDAFRAVLWAEALERRGDDQAARGERAFAERARRCPLDRASRSAWLDYSLYGVVACASMLFAQLAVLAGRGVLGLKRHRRRQPTAKSAWPGAIRRLPLLLVPVALALAISLAAHTASYVAFWSDRLSAGFGDAASIEKKPRLSEDRFPLTAVDLVADWLTNRGVETRAGYLAPPPLARMAQSVRNLGIGRQALLLAGITAGMFVLALPVGILLSWTCARAWAARWIPGAAQVRAGAPLWGYALFGLFVFAVVPLAWLGTARFGGAVPAPGIVSANFLLHSPLDQTLQPIDETEGDRAFDSRRNFERLRARSFVPLLFLYPGAELFACLVAVALAISVGTLVRTRRQEKAGAVPPP